MQPSIKDIVGRLETPDILNSRFIQLLNSLSGIRTISHLGIQQLDKEQFIDLAIKTIIEYLDAEEVSLYLLENNSLHCVANLNWEEFIANEPSINNKGNSYLVGEGIIGKTAENLQLIHIHNCKASDEDLIKYETNINKVGSLICAPIMANNTLLGVVELSHPEPNHFESWQEHSTVIYSDLLSMLLSNHKLLCDMQSIVDVRTEELRHALEESEKLRARYEEMSVIDPLTKLYNRRYFFSEVSSTLARAKRHAGAFSLLLMDLDHFKNVNDSFGHECGDNVLTTMSEILNQFTREGDTLARIGGEEFVFALSETNNEGAITLAERIRESIEKYHWKCNGKSMEIRISIGIATLEDFNKEEILNDDIQLSDILRKADLALYYVKQHGRNGVKSFSTMP